MRSQCTSETQTGDREFLRLPGLLRRWEIEQVVEAGREFYIEEAGKACDGTQLFAVYWREHNPDMEESK